MSAEALKQLRDWQRKQAGEQDRALRIATRAWQRLGELDRTRGELVDSLRSALDELEATGVTRDQAAAFLGLPAVDLQRVTSTTRSSAGRPDGPGNRRLPRDESHPAAPPNEPTGVDRRRRV